MFISIHRETNAAPLADITHVEDILLDPSTYPEVYIDDFNEPIENLNNLDNEKKFKRQTLNPEGMSQRLPISSEKMKELLRILNKLKKSEFLKLNGWSARGMPFNVLYTPNTLQQKFLSSMNSLPERKSVPQPLRRENYEPEKNQDKKEYLRYGSKVSNKIPQFRKHYLVIPQLFVSYGWGSLGK